MKKNPMCTCTLKKLGMRSSHKLESKKNKKKEISDRKWQTQQQRFKGYKIIWENLSKNHSH